MSFHFKPLNWAGSVDKRERYLPHWEQESCTYFVTWRLADSVDADTLQEWKRERDEFFLLHPKPWDESIEKIYNDRFTRRMERWLDSGHGSCVLRDWRCRNIIIECLNHFAGVRYELAAWVIMPNHIHVLVCPCPGWQLVRILQLGNPLQLAGSMSCLVSEARSGWMRVSITLFVTSRRWNALRNTSATTPSKLV